MTSRCVGTCLLIIAFALMSVGVASAQSPVLERIVESGKIRIGMSGDQAPLNAISRSGDFIGLEVDLANLIAEAMGVDVEFVQTPFPDLLPALKASSVDIVMSGMSITPERSLEAVFVGPYMISGKSILATSGALAEVRQASDINRPDVTVAALGNSTSQAFAEKRLPEAKLVTVESYDRAIQMVIQGEVDALVADMPACALAVLRYPEEDLETLSAPMTVEPIGIAVPATEIPLQMLLDNYLSAFEDSGLLEMLRVQWLERGGGLAQLP